MLALHDVDDAHNMLWFLRLCVCALGAVSGVAVWSALLQAHVPSLAAKKTLL